MVTHARNDGSDEAERGVSPRLPECAPLVGDFHKELIKYKKIVKQLIKRNHIDPYNLSDQ